MHSCRPVPGRSDRRGRREQRHERIPGRECRSATVRRPDRQTSSSEDPDVRTPHRCRTDASGRTVNVNATDRHATDNPTPTTTREPVPRGSPAGRARAGDEERHREGGIALPCLRTTHGTRNVRTRRPAQSSRHRSPARPRTMPATPLASGTTPRPQIPRGTTPGPQPPGRPAPTTATPRTPTQRTRFGHFPLRNRGTRHPHPTSELTHPETSLTCHQRSAALDPERNIRTLIH